MLHFGYNATEYYFRHIETAPYLFINKDKRLFTKQKYQL